MWSECQWVIERIVVLCSYFTGHTKNEQGVKQFVGGQTKFERVLDDLVEIFTVAVSISFEEISMENMVVSFLFTSLAIQLKLSNIVGYNCCSGSA